jgi:hypothetical protein
MSAATRTGLLQVKNIQTRSIHRTQTAQTVHFTFTPETVAFKNKVTLLLSLRKGNISCFTVVPKKLF